MKISYVLEKKIIWIGLLAFLLLLIIQHHYVGMYFDDYGYASLSYLGNTCENGMDYNIWDIFSFLKYHYENWGGRVLYFLFEIISFRLCGVEFLQIMQAIIIFWIIFMGCIISLEYFDKHKAYVIFLGVILSYFLYGTITITSAADGIYWYSASLFYIWPLCPFLTGIYFLNISPVKNKIVQNLLCVVLFALSAFSHEQIAVLVIVYLFSYGILHYLKTKEKGFFKKINFALIAAIIGGGIEILAPGNFVRADASSYTEFSNLSLLNKIVQQLPKVIDINVGEYNRIFCIILSVTLGFIGLFFLQYKWKRIVCLISGAFLFYFCSEAFLGESINSKYGTYVRMAFVLTIIIVTIIRYWYQENIVLLSLFVGGLFSQGMMLISPSISNRSHIMFEFVLHILIVECVVRFWVTYKNRFWRMFQVSGIILLCGYAVFNFAYILNGYAANYEILKINDAKMREASEQYKAGKDIEEIVLYRLKNDKFASQMFYQPGSQFIAKWMLNYYELPSSVTLLGGDISIAVEFDDPIGDWTKDGSFGGETSFCVNSQNNVIIEFRVENGDEESSNKLNFECGEDSQEVFLSSKETRYLWLHLPAGETTVHITASNSSAKLFMTGYF